MYQSEITWREATGQASSFNSRLLAERRMRQPFLDSATGVAQGSCHLWHDAAHRQPGRHPGEVYSYPERRWKKRKASGPAATMDDGMADMLHTQELYGEGGTQEGTTFPTSITSGSLPARPFDSTGAPVVSTSLSTVVGASDHSANGVVPGDGASPAPPATVGQSSSGAGPSLRSGVASGGVYGSASAGSSKGAWYNPQDMLGDEPDYLDMMDDPSDGSDYEEAMIKKKKKKKANNNLNNRRSKVGLGGGSRPEEEAKPFSCDLCPIRYKTKQGLQYHLTHFHGSAPSGSGGQPPAPSSSVTPTAPAPSGHGSASSSSEYHLPTPMTMARESHSGISMGEAPQGDGNRDGLGMGSMSSGPLGRPGSSGSSSGKPSPNDYCDFCLGDSELNKKTRSSEKLVSCADCGRSGHPSCLQFSDNMKVSVTRYPWQCIECKSCGLCGTSENDDQLLFCDDCDRGYHMYCLTPPLKAPPEGTWSCHLCIQEFHSGSKP